MQHEESATPIAIDYRSPPHVAAWRQPAAFALSVIEGGIAGFLIIVTWPFAVITLPLFCLALPFHLCRMATRLRVVIGLMFCASLALVAAMVANGPSGPWQMTFTSLFCIGGCLSLFVSVPMTLAARRAA